MRLVVDTNVLVSAFLWEGLPGHLIALAGERECQLFTSRPLLDELARTLAKQKLSKHVAATGLTAQEMVKNYRQIATLVSASSLTSQVSRDVDDDQVLACALAARADIIVSGDDDLLSLEVFQDIPIVRVARGLEMMAGE